MVPRRLSPTVLPLLLCAAACSDATGPRAFTSATAPGVYFATAQNDSTYPQAMGRDSASGCDITRVGGYLVLSADGTYHGPLFGLHFTCPDGSLGRTAMVFLGTYEVRDTAILFHDAGGPAWDFAAKPSGWTSAGPDLDIMRPNWSGYSTRVHLQREPNSATAARRIQDLDLPSGLEDSGNAP